jgi:hypothetical protein
MPPPRFNDAKHWRDRADEMRALAAGYADKEAARIMKRLADDYDRLADRAQRRSESDLDRLPSALPKDEKTL